MSDRHDEMSQAFSMIESVYSSLRTENAKLQSQLYAAQQQLEHNRRQQVQTVEALRAENESLMKHNDMLQGEVSRLRRVESDRIVRSALDQTSDVHDAHEPTVNRSWQPSSSQPLGHSSPGQAHYSSSSHSQGGHMHLYSNSSASGRPPRAPAPPSSGAFELDTSGVHASTAGVQGGNDSMNDSIASSRSLLRALQGTGSASVGTAAADDGELAALMSALSAAAPSSSTAAAGATSGAVSTASTATSTPGRSAPGDHVLNNTRGSVAEQLQRVAAAQSRLAASTREAAASAQEQTRAPGARQGTAAALSDQWWNDLAHAVPADRVDLLRSYLAQHDAGKLSASSLATRARVLLVDSVTSAARTASGGAVASKSSREALVQQLSRTVGGE